MCRLSSMAYTSFSGSLWRGNTSQPHPPSESRPPPSGSSPAFPVTAAVSPDYVLTVCDNAKQSCPVFFEKAVRLHHGFRDPAAVEGTSEIRLGAFRKVRDELLGCWTEGCYQQE